MAASMLSVPEREFRVANACVGMRPIRLAASSSTLAPSSGSSTPRSGVSDQSSKSSAKSYYKPGVLNGTAPIQRRFRGPRPIQKTEVAVLPEGYAGVVPRNLYGLVLGRGGVNVRSICEETSVRAWVTGCPDGSDESRGHMRVVVQGSGDVASYEKAVELVTALVQSVQENMVKHSLETGAASEDCSDSAAEPTVESRKETVDDRPSRRQQKRRTQVN